MLVKDLLANVRVGQGHKVRIEGNDDPHEGRQDGVRASIGAATWSCKGLHLVEQGSMPFLVLETGAPRGDVDLVVPGVDFTNILCAAFKQVDPISIKKTDGLTEFFALTGSACIKAAHETLVKLTPDDGVLVRHV